MHILFWEATILHISSNLTDKLVLSPLTSTLGSSCAPGQNERACNAL